MPKHSLLVVLLLLSFVDKTRRGSPSATRKIPHEITTAKIMKSRMLFEYPAAGDLVP